MKNIKLSLFFIITCFHNFNLYSQDSNNTCKVALTSLIGKYQGECKKGYANGKGEATGLQYYIGFFEDGLPNGKGIFYYTDSVYHSGNFQDGIREGKGETHYIIAGKPDSIIKGFWSGDEYKGKNYVTHSFRSNTFFDIVDINSSTKRGNTITITIQTTNGIPNAYGQDAMSNTISGTITLTDLTAIDGIFIRKITSTATTSRFSATYEITKFPIKLMGTLSNGKTFDLELYKSAKWAIRLFANI